jgi:hypothetical protein
MVYCKHSGRKNQSGGQLCTQIFIDQITSNQVLFGRPFIHFYSAMAANPPLMWAQDRTRVFVTIKLQDIENESVTFGEASFTFKGRTRSPSAVYDFPLELFAEILPDDEETKISQFGRYTQLNIRKKDITVWWPRLAKTTERLHNLRIDWEKWVEEDECSAPPIAPKKIPSTEFSSGSDSDSDEKKEEKETDPTTSAEKTEATASSEELEQVSQSSDDATRNDP